MSTSVGRIDLDLGLNYKAFNKDLNGIAPKAASLVKGVFGKFGLVAGAAFSAKALWSFGKGAINLASDLIEVQNVVDVTFGKMSENVNEFAKNSLESFGLSELSAKKYTSTMGAMLKSSGFGTKAAANMSIEMAKLTADMASFYNLDTDTAFNKIRAGISGETEPLKQLGINMNVANLEAFALSQGIKKAYNQMSQSEQVMLRYNYLLKTSADSQGDFARNSQTWANQTKILTEKWKEFMSLIGKALMEILLPTVKFLNKALDVLIGITKEIGKIYTLITGKEVVVEANNAMSSSAEDAAGSENALGKEIKKAGKEAKKALAPFDELNILQKNLASGADDASGLNNLGDLDTAFNTKQVNDGLTTGFKKAEDDGNRFYLWFADWRNKIKELASQPIYVQAPIFATIPNPVYNPNWGLETPEVPQPLFPPIPKVIYRPNWNLTPPVIPEVEFPLIPNPIYNPVWNLEPPQVKVPVIPAINWESFNKSLETGKAWAKEKWEAMGRDTKEFLGNVVTDFQTHKSNLELVTKAIGLVVINNTKAWLKTKGENIAKGLTSIQEGLQTFGSNVGAVAGEISKVWIGNTNEWLKTTANNLSNFISSSGNAFVSWGSGMVRIAGEAGKGIVSNIVNGLSTAWSNFKEAMSKMGEKVSNWWSGNKEVVVKTAIAGVAIGGAAIGLALAGPAVLPYAAAGLKALSVIPALAKGGIVDQPTLAMVGERGKEAVMPLENNTGWISDLALKIAEILGLSGNVGSSGQPIYLTIKIGEDTLLEYLIDAIGRENMLNGGNVIPI